eukprot:scaffold288_cov143-Ochromonas_danica.AAC.12
MAWLFLYIITTTPVRAEAQSACPGQPATIMIEEACRRIPAIDFVHVGNRQGVSIVESFYASSDGAHGCKMIMHRHEKHCRQVADLLMQRWMIGGGRRVVFAGATDEFGRMSATPAFDAECEVEFGFARTVCGARGEGWGDCQTSFDRSGAFFYIVSCSKRKQNRAFCKTIPFFAEKCRSSYGRLVRPACTFCNGHPAKSVRHDGSLSKVRIRPRGLPLRHRF